MTDFGGCGGIVGGRPRDESDLFENAVERQLGEAMREDPNLCKEVWCATSNVTWRNAEEGHTASYSFRAAGDLVAAILGRGDYMDWYCSGHDGEVSERVAEAMLDEGWEPK